MARSKMEQETDRIAEEADLLRSNIVGAEGKLTKLKNRLDALSILVRKQAEHFKNLVGAEVTSLADYKDMRLKHNQNRKARDEVKNEVEKVEYALKKSKARLDEMDKLVADRRRTEAGRGTVRQLRKP